MPIQIEDYNREYSFNDVFIKPGEAADAYARLAFLKAHLDHSDEPIPPEAMVKVEKPPKP